MVQKPSKTWKYLQFHPFLDPVPDPSSPAPAQSLQIRTPEYTESDHVAISEIQDRGPKFTHSERPRPRISQTPRFLDLPRDPNLDPFGTPFGTPGDPISPYPDIWETPYLAYLALLQSIPEEGFPTSSSDPGPKYLRTLHPRNTPFCSILVSSDPKMRDPEILLKNTPSPDAVPDV